MPPGGWVMDAKWKRWDIHLDPSSEEELQEKRTSKFTVSREDLFQINSYCRVLEHHSMKSTNSFTPARGFLVYPITKSIKHHGIDQLQITIDRLDIPLHISIIPWRILDSENETYGPIQGIDELRKRYFPTT